MAMDLAEDLCFSMNEIECNEATVILFYNFSIRDNFTDIFKKHKAVFITFITSFSTTKWDQDYNGKLFLQLLPRDTQESPIQFNVPSDIKSGILFYQIFFKTYIS